MVWAHWSFYCGTSSSHSDKLPVRYLVFEYIQGLKAVTASKFLPFKSVPLYCLILCRKFIFHKGWGKVTNLLQSYLDALYILELRDPAFKNTLNTYYSIHRVTTKNILTMRFNKMAFSPCPLSSFHTLHQNSNGIINGCKGTIAKHDVVKINMVNRMKLYRCNRFHLLPLEFVLSVYEKVEVMEVQRRSCCHFLSDQSALCQTVEWRFGSL